MSKTLLHESSPNGLVKNADGTYRVVLITPGLGSTGEYTEEVLRAYCAETWPAGSHSYVDHPTPNNPGRSPKNQIGVLAEDAHYEDGVGVVSKLKVFKHWQDFVAEVAPSNGLSIYARGEGKKEMREGREVTVVESFIPDVQNTVDLVSYAGRGGHFAESAEALYEAAIEQSTQSESSAGTEKKDNEDMATIDEVKALLEALTATVAGLVAEQVAARESAATKDAEVVDSAKAVKDAIEATRAVEAAEVSKSVKDNLIKSIEAGNYDVTAQLEEAKTLREEILAEVATAFGGRAGTPTDRSDFTVAGWSK
jgi:hypothetical protein